MSQQPGILPDVPDYSCYLEFASRDDAAAALAILAAVKVDEHAVIGLGQPLLRAAGKSVAGLTAFPELPATHVAAPATQLDLWIWCRGATATEVDDRAQQLLAQLQSSFKLVNKVAGFKHDGGRDLTGYEDGTENPEGDAAVQAAIAAGASFVAVQKWQHDLQLFEGLSREEQDNIFGRHKDSNEEFDAPESAHVKRTAQEDFDPEAFVLRRSSPWRDGDDCGLMFVAFGSSFYAFEAQMKRMMGLDDDIVDGVFTYSKALTGGYYWCPPVGVDGLLQLRSLA